MFVRTFSGTRTLSASSSCSSLISLSWFPSHCRACDVDSPSWWSHDRGDWYWERRFSGHEGRLNGGDNKGTSFPQYREWYCVRCQRGGCWATKFSCFRYGLSRLESEAATGGFPQPTGKGGGKGRASSGRRNIPGVLVVMVCLVTFHLQLGVCLIKGIRLRGWQFRLIS